MLKQVIMYFVMDVVKNIAHYTLFQEEFVVKDIRQGKLAGAKTIAVTWGFQSAAILRIENPDYMANSPNDILDIIKCLS